MGKSSHAAVANIAIDYSGANSGQVITDADGCYYIEANGSITLTPVAPQNATFLAADPASIQITSSSNNIDFAVSIGMYETSWGSPDSGLVDIAAGVSDTIYSTDPYKNWIQQFNKYGALLATWGSYGSADGQFNNPLGVAVDAAGNVYVADANNNRIQKFNSNGTYLTQWGSLGSDVGELDRPVYIAVDTADNVYVTEMNNQRVQKFNSNGVHLTSLGSFGNADGQFNGPLGIAVDTFDNVYVVDSVNRRIQKFTDDTFLTKWDRPTSTHSQFYYPVCITLDSLNNIYITDNGSCFVMKFNQIQ